MCAAPGDRSVSVALLSAGALGGAVELSLCSRQPQCSPDALSRMWRYRQPRARRTLKALRSPRIISHILSAVPEWRHCRRYLAHWSAQQLCFTDVLSNWFNLCWQLLLSLLSAIKKLRSPEFLSSCILCLSGVITATMYV